MSFKVSPHSHPESPISGSTVESMIDRAVELGREYFAYTDPAYMTSIFRGYDYAKSKNIKYIPGVEVFFKDQQCSILKGSNAEKSAYFKITLYATDQKGFEALSEISSMESKINVTHYGESYPAHDWSTLEYAANNGLIACSSDIHDMVAKHMVTETPQIGEQVFLKLKSLFGNRYYAVIVGNKTTHGWVNLVHMKFYDGSEEVVFADSRVSTNSAKFAKAKEIVEKPNRHIELKSFQKGFVTVQVDNGGKKIASATLESGFLRLPVGDAQLLGNKLLYALSKKHNVKVLYSDYAFYSTPEDKAVQDVRLSQDDIREHTQRHMQTSEEAVGYLKNIMGLPDSEVERLLNQNNEWAKQFDNFSLKYEYRLPEVPGGRKALDICLEQIRSLGRLPADKPEYVSRLQYEISVLAKNGKVDLTPYFLPIKDVFDFYRENKRLTGPARGSAGGSLFTYLMGITHVDPIKHDLSFERFLSLDRILNNDYPDIDCDLVDREPLVGPDGKSGYLYTRWGDKAAQISTRIQLRLKSAIKDVNRYLNGSVDPVVEKLSKALPPPPQGISDADYVFGFEDSDGNHLPGLIEVSPDLKQYSVDKPKEWDLVQRCLGISRQNSKHASAFVISDIPIRKVLPTFMGGNITQYEAKAVEKAKLIKYDFLVVNQLKDIELCMNFINQKAGIDLGAGYFRHNNKDIFIWDLEEEEAVFKSVWLGDTKTIFQINTQSMVPFVQKIKPRSLIDLATILALVRPGPLDFVDPDTGLTMADEYVERRDSKGTIKLPELVTLLPETYGVQVFQEQTTKAAKEIGKMKASDAENLRRAFSKKQKTKALAMKPLFMEGAIKEVGIEKAEMIWAQMETSSRYSFNKSHAVAYAMITYACMYLKHHYPLEWWAAVLTNANEQEISTELFKHIREQVLPPDINLSSNTMAIDYDQKKLRAKLGVLSGLGEKVSKPIIDNAPYSDIKEFIKKKVAGPSLTKKLIHVGVMDSLFKPGSTLIDKMQAYEDAIEEVAYEQKIENGKKVKEKKKGTVDSIYLSMSPLEDFKAKKLILPTLPVNLSNLVSKYGPLMNESMGSRPKYSDSKGRPQTMLTGDELFEFEQRLPLEKNAYFCVPAFIVKAEEFSFSKNEKKALKLFIDTDGRISERVLWPAWGENAPKYPKTLAKGSIVLLFMGAKEFKPDLKLFEVKVIA